MALPDKYYCGLYCNACKKRCEAIFNQFCWDCYEKAFPDDYENVGLETDGEWFNMSFTMPKNTIVILGEMNVVIPQIDTV